MLYIKTKRAVSPYLLGRNYLHVLGQDKYKKEYTCRLVEFSSKGDDDDDSLQQLVENLIAAGEDAGNKKKKKGKKDVKAEAPETDDAEKVYGFSVYESAYGGNAGYSREAMWDEFEDVIRKFLKQSYNIDEFEIIKKPGYLYEKF